MNKKGMEMSINVIVGLILGMLMFGAGIVIFTKVIDLTDKATTDVDAEIEERMLNSRYSGEKLFVLETDVASNGKKSAAFIYSIHNVLPAETNFKLVIAPSSGSLIIQKDILFLDIPFKLESKEKIVKQFHVTPSNTSIKRNSQQGVTMTVLYEDTTAAPPNNWKEYAKLPVRVIKQ